MSFESLLGFYSRAQGSYAIRQIVSPLPREGDRSNICETLQNDYNGPQNFVKSLNESVTQHMAKRMPILFSNFQSKGVLPTEFMCVGPMLSERVLAAQATCALIDSKKILTHWETFGLYTMLQYMETLLCASDTIYQAVSAREWLIKTFYYFMLKDKFEYSYKIITHAKSKNIRSCTAVIHGSTVKIYNNGQILLDGPLIYSSDMKEGTFGVHDNATGEEVRLSMMTLDGKKISSSFAAFMKDEKDINIIIWSCKAAAKQRLMPQWYDVLGRMFLGYDGSWLQSVFTMPSLDNSIFDAIDTVAGFYGRSFFPLKAAIWWLVENANDAETAFGKSCVAMNYVERYFKKHGGKVIGRLIDKMVRTIEAVAPENRSSQECVGSVIYTFWTELKAPMLPRSIYEALRFIFIATFKKFGSICANPYIGIGIMFLSKTVIQTIIETPQKEKTVRSCLILACKSISQCITPPEDGRYDSMVATGKQYLNLFLQSCTAEFKGKLDVNEEPELEEFIDAVTLMHQFTLDNESRMRSNLKHDCWRWKLAEEVMFSIYLRKTELAATKTL